MCIRDRFWLRQRTLQGNRWCSHKKSLNSELSGSSYEHSKSFEKFRPVSALLFTKVTVVSKGWDGVPFCYFTLLTLPYLTYCTYLWTNDFLAGCDSPIENSYSHRIWESENLGTEDLGILSRQGRSGMLENQSSRLGAEVLTRRRPEGSADKVKYNK